MFRLAFEAVNIGLMVGTTITSEVLKKKLQDLQNDLNDIQDQLKKVNLNLQDGANFFRGIVDEAHQINWQTAEIDVFTNSKLAPLITTLVSDGTTLLTELEKIPNPDIFDRQGTPWWQEALDWLSRAISVAAIIWYGAGFYSGLKKYWQERKAKLQPGDEGVQVMMEDIEKASGKIIEDTPVEITAETATEVPGLPKEENTTSRMEKLGKAFDGIFFVFGVVSLVMTVVEYARDEQALESAIDEMKDNLAKAKVEAANIEEDEAKFYHDMPSTFLMMKAQLTQIVQIAAASKLIRSPETERDKPLDELIVQAQSFLYFKDDDFVFMNQKVTELNDIEAQFVQPSDAKNAAFEKVWKEVEARIPTTTWQDAFKQAPNLYSTLTEIIRVSFDNFNFLNSMVAAIRVVRKLVPDGITTAPAGISLFLLATVLSGNFPSDFAVPPEMPLNIIALYTGYAGDTYETPDDVKTIRAANPTIDRNAWKKWVDDSAQSLSA